jgi:putative membrane protein insertion efficiency factor
MPQTQDQRESVAAEASQRQWADDNAALPTAAISIPARVGIWLVRQYQFWLGPLLGGRCRFFPSCSDYSILALRKHGFWRGAWKTLVRLSKCQPFHPGGIDYP